MWFLPFLKSAILDIYEVSAALARAIFMKSDEALSHPINAPTSDISPATPPDVPSRTISTFPSKIVSWAHIIGQEEGANPISNNAGNLKYSTLTASWGASKGHPAADGGFFCHFETPEDGVNALCNFLKLACEDELIAYHSPEARTLGGFTKIYAGNPPEGYILAIANFLHEPLDVQISTFL